MPRRSTPDPLASAIGLRIKQLRQEQGVTAEKLAYESEVGSKGFLSDIEHGLALPSLVTLERIAQRLEVSLFDLLVVPDRSDRERLLELTRRMPKGSVTRWLRELTNGQPHEPMRNAPPLHPIRAYATLEVAAGWSLPSSPSPELTTEMLRLPGRFNRSRDFAVRASGHSMQGFRSTIHHGDWLIVRKASMLAESAVGKVVVLAREDRFGDKSLHLKRVVQIGRRLWFRSDDPEVKPMAASESDRIIGVLVSVVPPSTLAPPPHSRLAKAEFCRFFGLEREPDASWSRLDGHLFFVIERGDRTPKGQLNVERCSPRPAETAFVLLNEGDQYEYLGIAAFDESRGTWALRESEG